MISIENLSKIYRTRKGPHVVLDKINLQIGKGEKVGIFGRNGAGKSTLIRLIGGIEFPTSGRIRRLMSVSWPLAYSGSFQVNLTGFDNLRFNFVHLREVAYFSSAPVPEEIAGLVALYVQEIPPMPGAPLSDGNLISSLFIYPLRQEWRFVWGNSAGRLYKFDNTAQMREKVLRDLRSVLVGSTGFRRWPEQEQIARIPAQFLEGGKDETQQTIGFLKPSLKVQRSGALGAERATGPTTAS